MLVFPLAGVADDVAPEAMDPRQDFMSGRSVHRAEVDSLVATIFRAPVGGVPVRNEQAADGGVVADEGVEALAIDVDDPLQAAACRIFSSLNLDRPRS